MDGGEGDDDMFIHYFYLTPSSQTPAVRCQKQIFSMGRSRAWTGLREIPRDGGEW
jgi:hypothetical protein